MGCACNAASRAGQGVSYRIWKLFPAVIPTVATFLPYDRGAAHSQNVPCRPIATGTLPTNTETGMTTTTCDRASACCSVKEPTANKPTMRRLRQRCTNTTTAQPRRDHKQTTRKPANTKLARHAWVKTRTASDRSATPWCATPANHHIHEHNKTPRLYPYEPDQPTLTNYTTLRLGKPRRN